MKQVSLSLSLWMWSVVARSDAWSNSPGAVNIPRRRDVALRSSKASVVWAGNEIEIEDEIEDASAGLVTMAKDSAVVSRRNLFRGASVSAIGIGIGMGVGRGTISPAHAWTVDKVEPDENDIYAVAQNATPNSDSNANSDANDSAPIRVLWVGSGAFAIRSGAARSGVYKDLFLPHTEVTALDLLTPTRSDLRAAKKYAKEQGGYALKFRTGDATNLKFENESFDAVVSSLFLCQDFDPEVVVREIQRVLKPGGRYGFYEHIEDIDKVVVGKVFGEASVVKVEAYPEMHNILAGVVKKVVS